MMFEVRMSRVFGVGRGTRGRRAVVGVLSGVLWSRILF